MKVSVVLCTYDPDSYEHFSEAAESVLDQEYEDVELVVVVDGNEEVAELVRHDYGEMSGVSIHVNKENIGLLRSRNRGTKVASGDIVAFIDDDAVADESWIQELVSAYERSDVIAAGGRMEPEWAAGEPIHLPAEFYWLVGVTHRGFPEEAQEVRNTFGSNISFRRSVFLELDGFNPEIGGRQGDKNLQGGETELCVRMRHQYGQGVWYEPKAVVYHKVFKYRTRTSWLIQRAFWQGYSKRAMQVMLPGSDREEGEFLLNLIFKFFPHRMRKLITTPSLQGFIQLLAIVVFTVAVGTGYVYGLMRWR